MKKTIHKPSHSQSQLESRGKLKILLTCKIFLFQLSVFLSYFADSVRLGPFSFLRTVGLISVYNIDLNWVLCCGSAYRFLFHGFLLYLSVLIEGVIISPPDHNMVKFAA